MISLERIKERKLFQWALAYLAGAWLVLQVLDLLGDAFGWPADVQQIAIVLLAVGFLAALVLAWYHGEKGQQRVSGPELFMLSILLVIAGGAVTWVRQNEGGATASYRAEGAASLDPKRVLVSVFENRTGDPALDPLGSMAADWITRGLSETGLVEVASFSTALASAQKVSTGGDPLSDLARVRVLAEAAGTGTVVSGSYYRQGGAIQFQAHITDAIREKLLRTITPVSVPTDSALQGVEDLRQRVMGALATIFDPKIASMSSHARPPTYEAYREFIQGQELFTNREFRAAIPHLIRATALDTTFAAPLMQAAAAHINLGEYAEADSINRIVERSQERLLPSERHLLDYGSTRVAGDHAGALRAARQVVALLPDSEWRYLHGYSAVVVNRPKEALETLRQLDPRRGWLAGWTGYWHVLARARHMLGQHRRELKEARQAREQFPELLSTLSSEVRALAALGRVEEVNERLDESLTLPPERGWSPGTVSLRAATELRAHGEREAAQEAANRAIAWYTAQPAKQQETEAQRYGLAQALYQAGRWSEAGALFQVLAADKPDNVDYKGHLGVLAARTGDRAAAMRISEALGSLERPYLSGQHLYWQARIAAVLGERERAVTLLRNAYAEGRRHDASVHAEMDFESLRDYPPFRELLRPKG